MNFTTFMVLGVLACVTIRAENDGASFSVTELQPLNFGVIPNATRKCILKQTGELTGGCYGTGIPGEMLVRGMEYYSYTASVNGHGWNDGVNFSPKLPRQNYIFDSKGKHVAIVVGLMRIRSAQVTSGTLNMTYTFTVNYQ